MQLALIFLVGFMAWVVAWKCRQGGEARRYGLAIIAVLIGAPIVIVLLLMAGNISLALWMVPAALFTVAVLWGEMFTPPE